MSGLLTSCDKPIPNPETLDPIYADLLKQSEEAKKEADAQKADIAKTDADIQKAGPRDAVKKQLIQQKYQKEHHLVGLEQRAEYFKARADHRLDFDQTSYLSAYNAKKPWPNPAEFQEYKTIKKLQSDSRNWDDRVPKTTRYNKNQSPGGAKKEEKKPEGKKEGGE